MSAPPNALLELFRAARQFADATYPGHRGIEVTIETADGRRTVLQVPPCACEPTPGPGTRAGLAHQQPLVRENFSEVEWAVLEALAGLGPGGKLEFEDLAAAAGHPPDSRLRAVAAALVRRRLLVNLRPGYALAPGVILA